LTLANAGDTLFRNVADHAPKYSASSPDDRDPHLHHCEDLKTRKDSETRERASLGQKLHTQPKKHDDADDDDDDDDHHHDNEEQVEEEEDDDHDHDEKEMTVKSLKSEIRLQIYTGHLIPHRKHTAILLQGPTGSRSLGKIRCIQHILRIPKNKCG
jgi:hypothetical protein